MQNASLMRSILGGASSHIADESKKAFLRGSMAGCLVHYLWHAMKSHPNVSWEDAMRAAEDIAPVGKISGSRSTFAKAKSDFSKVLHFWGALSINYYDENKGGFDLGSFNLASFLSEAFVLVQRMREWEAASSRGGVFASPKYYVPLEVFDWRQGGALKRGSLA